MSGRVLWVKIHRWVGLVMALFLIVVGLTGAVLAWYGDLDAYFASDLHRLAPHSPAATALDPLGLREAARTAHPEADLNAVELWPRDPSTSVRFRVAALEDPITHERPALPYTEFYLDPVTGEVLGDRRWGDISQGVKNLIPFVEVLHTSLALGVVGSYWFGIIALLWTFDCFVGAYLTLPPGKPRRQASTSAASAARRSWWQRWKPAWKIRWLRGTHRLNFDVHRAGGLWLWAMLFVFAWSSVNFNLREVYLPVMDALFGMQPAPESEPATASSSAARWQAEPGIHWRDAYSIATRQCAAVLESRGLRKLNEVELRYDPASVAFSYTVRTGALGDSGSKAGSLTTSFDANTGLSRTTSIQPPAEVPLGEAITEWLDALHVAGIWGMPYRIFVTFTGLVIVSLSVTGIYLWMKKRTARSTSVKRSSIATL